MKIKNISKYFGTFVIFVGVFFGALFINTMIFPTSGMELVSTEAVNDKIGKLNKLIELDVAPEVISELAGTDILEMPSVYDSRKGDCDGVNGCVGRVKDQQNEGLCWAYTTATVIESYLLKQGVNTEISAKHLDYLLANPLSAFESAVSNPYAENLGGMIGGMRTLGGGGNFLVASYGMTGKYSVVGENEFYSKVKEEKGLEQGSFEEAIAKNGGVFGEKLRAGLVMDKGAVDYVVTGYKDYNYLKYGEDGFGGKSELSRGETIKKIKNDIVNYGALEVDSYFDLTNCGYLDSAAKNVILIDKGKDICDTDKAHAMTVVGWDDNFEYRDGETAKNGAFIVQNSSGKDLEDQFEFYFAYDSDFAIYAVNSVDERDKYGEILDYTDATERYIDEDGSIVYRFATGQKEKISKITVTQRMYIGELGLEISLSGLDGDFVEISKLNYEATGMVAVEPENAEVDGEFAVKITLPEGNRFSEENGLKFSMIGVLMEKKEAEEITEPEVMESEETEEDTPYVGEITEEPVYEEEIMEEKTEKKVDEEVKKDTKAASGEEEAKKQQEIWDIVRENLAISEDERVEVPDTGRMTEMAEGASGVQVWMVILAGLEAMILTFFGRKIWLLVRA